MVRVPGLTATIRLSDVTVSRSTVFSLLDMRLRCLKEGHPVNSLLIVLDQDLADLMEVEHGGRLYGAMVRVAEGSPMVVPRW